MGACLLLWEDLLLFGRFRKVLRLSLIRFVNDPYTLYNRLNVSRLARFRKTQKLVNQGKMQCWALLVISKATNLKRRNKTTKQFPNRRIIDSLRKHPFSSLRLRQERGETDVFAGYIIDLAY